MTQDLVLTQHDAATARSVMDKLVAVFLEVHAEGGPFYSEERYRHQLASHLKAPGFALVVATIDGDVVGYIYGFTVQPHGRTWEGLQTPLPADFTHEDGHRTFALCELMVRPSWRRRGIAKALHDELIKSRSEERAELLARPDNAVAQSAYASWGWRKVAQLRPHWEHAPLYDVLILQLSGPA